jgi:hypothetical protein
MTNIVLMSWLLVATNTEVFSNPVSATEQEQITRTVEYRTNVQVTVTSNVIGTVRLTLRFNGTNWVPGLPSPRQVVLPPLPLGLNQVGTAGRAIHGRLGEATLPQPPLPRFGFPTIPPPPAPMNTVPAVFPLPTAEELQRAKLWDKHR